MSYCGPLLSTLCFARVSTNDACQGSLPFWQGYSNNNTSSELKCKRKEEVLGIRDGALLSVCFIWGAGKGKVVIVAFSFIFVSRFQ